MGSSSKWTSRGTSLEYGWKRTILKGESRRSSKGWKRTIRDESRRSLDESRRSLRKQTIFQLKQTIFWGKADDLWVKADDPERKQTISRAESGRSCLKFLRVKTADLKGWKRTILSEFFYRVKTADLKGWKRTILSEIFMCESRRSMSIKLFYLISRSRVIVRIKISIVKFLTDHNPNPKSTLTLISNWS